MIGISTTGGAPPAGAYFRLDITDSADVNNCIVSRAPANGLAAIQLMIGLDLINPIISYQGAEDLANGDAAHLFGSLHNAAGVVIDGPSVAFVTTFGDYMLWRMLSTLSTISQSDTSAILAAVQKVF